MCGRYKWYNVNRLGTSRLRRYSHSQTKRKKKDVRYLFQLHLQEARFRSLYACVSLAFAMCICYKYSNELLYLSVRPLLYLDKSFIFTELTEAFYVTLKVCALWSFGFTLPFLLYQSWCFIAPSWFSLERTRWGIVLLLCGCFSALAIAVTYTVLLPKVASVLLTFEVLDPILSIQLEARIGPYIDLTLKTTLLAIVLLQLPILFCICFYLEVFKPSLLTSNRKFLLISSLLIAAVVSPPDVVAQCALTVLLSLWWEGVALFGFVILRLKETP